MTIIAQRKVHAACSTQLVQVSKPDRGFPFHDRNLHSFLERCCCRFRLPTGPKEALKTPLPQKRRNYTEKRTKQARPISVCFSHTSTYLYLSHVSRDHDLHPRVVLVRHDSPSPHPHRGAPRHKCGNPTNDPAGRRVVAAASFDGTPWVSVYCDSEARS